MARQIMFGAETGHVDECGIQYGGSNGIAVVTTFVRSGAYAMQLRGSAYPSNYWRRFGLPDGAVAECYGAVAVRPYALPGSDMGMVLFLDSAFGEQASIGIQGTSGRIVAWRGKRTTQLALSDDPHCSGAAWMPNVEWHLLVHNAAGRFRVWMQGVLVIDFTGNTQQTGNADIASVCIGFDGPSISSTSYWYFDDLRVNNTAGPYENGRVYDGAVLLKRPNGAGGLTQWTPSAGDNWNCVDEVPASAADYVKATEADLADLYALAALPPAYNRVRCLQPISHAALAVAGSGGLRHRLRSGGGDFDDDADLPLSTTYAMQRGKIYHRDPADDAEWSVEKVDALQVGPVAK